jgi:uncharacterized damage-inducible protein DinB
VSAEANRAIANFLIAEFEYEAQTTAKVLAAVPSEGNGYQPDAKSKTALGLVRHIAIEDQWMLNSVVGGSMAPPADESDACGIMTPADGAAFYGAQIPAALEKVKALSDEDLARIIDFFGIMQLPTVNLLSIALKHSIHHRGQLSSYLRAAGGKVPGIYGPSGDSQ